jgi:uncharacterized membrane protein YsdA (DUF1294 family)
MLKTSYIIRYVLGINIITFFVFGIDKWKARNQASRISEKTLLKFCLLGGGVWALLAMEFFRHKTQKWSFLLKYYIIIILWIFLVIYSLLP